MDTPVRTNCYMSAILTLIFSTLSLVTIVACAQGSNTVLFISDRDGNLEIYSTDPSTTEQINLTNSLGDEFAVTVSPNRRKIAFVSKSKRQTSIEVMEIDGTSRTLLATDPSSRESHIWDPDSNRIAFISGDMANPLIYVINSDGSQRTLLTALPGGELGGWSKKDNSVVFAVRRGEARGIYSRNPDGVNEFKITESHDHSPIWSPDERKIAFLSTRDGNPEVYVINDDGSEQTRLTATDSSEYHLSWSPNGKQLLFVSERDGNADIYVANSDGANQTRLTHNSVRDDQPVWSPDGKSIAFVSYMYGDAEIFVMDADGTNQTRITNNPAEDTSPAW